MRWILPGLGLGIVLAGCGRDSQALRPEPDTAAAIHLEVATGPGAGRYQAAAFEAVCSEGLTGPGSWGVQYSAQPAESLLGSLQLLVPSEAAAPLGTRRFYLGVTLGSFAHGASHEIETRMRAGVPSGEGSVVIHDDGPRATVLVHGHTADGVGLSATIQCQQVRRFGAVQP